MKRFLSILLAVMLVCTMLPAVSAATVAENGNTVYNYVFSSKALGSETDVACAVASGTASDNTSSPLGGIMDYDDIVSDVSEKWDFLANRSSNGNVLRTEGMYFRTQSGNVRAGANGVIIKINVPESGKYVPTVVADGATHGGIANVWFFSASEALEREYAMQNVDQYTIQGITTSSKFSPIGSIDTYASNGGDVKIDGPVLSETFAPMNLEAGDHYLVFAISDVRESLNPDGVLPGNVYMNIRSFSIEKLSPASISVSADVSEINIGETATVSATVLDVNAEELPDAVTFESSDPSVATVDAKTGVVTAKSVGTVTITATVAETEIEDSVELQIIKTNRYVLSSAARIKGTTTDLSVGTYEEGDGVGYDTIDASLTSPWDFLGVRTIATGKFQVGGMYYGSAAGDTKLGNNGVCFKFNVSESGVYRPSLQYSEIQVGGKVNMYVITKEIVAERNYDMVRSNGESQSINGIILNNTPAISVNTYNKDLNEQTFKDVLSVSANSTVNLSAGDHYVILAFDGLNSDESLINAPQQMWIKSFSMTKLGDYTPPEDTVLSDAFDAVEEKFTPAPLSTAKVSTFTAKLGESKDKDNAVIASETATLGETYTVNAPEAEEGYKFLYWAKGMSTDKKQIVSYNESYSFIPTVENTYLIAVYEAINGENSEDKAEFYNANGQLIATLNSDGKAPALPEMAGYNAAEGWALYGTSEVIAAGADVEVSGVKVYVAKFGDVKTVKVNEEDVAYGDKVSFTASEKKNWLFKAWKKNGVVVSTDPTYSFFAWEDCTVEAMYTRTEPNFTGIARKILIDTFSAGDETAVMAEFIGFEGAVEKGIMLGTKRFAMTTDASQFTIVNDEDANEIKGYAIFKDGTIVYDN